MRLSSSSLQPTVLALWILPLGCLAPQQPAPTDPNTIDPDRWKKSLTPGQKAALIIGAAAGGASGSTSTLDAAREAQQRDIEAQIAEQQLRAQRERLLWEQCTAGVADACRQAGISSPATATATTPERDLVKADAAACNSGDGQACVRAGAAFEQGLGVKANYQMAATAYRKACKAQNGYGCWFLGALYHRGQIEGGDPTVVVELFDEGCRLGAGELCVALGDAQTDPQVAATYFDHGCMAGNAEACARLNEQAALAEAQHDARAREEAAKVPPWQCFAVQLGEVRLGWCHETLADCKEHLKGATNAVSGTKVLHRCEAQPLAACFSVNDVLRGERLECIESFEGCNAYRASFYEEDGRTLRSDFAAVGKCRPMPTSWVDTNPR